MSKLMIAEDFFRVTRVAEEGSSGVVHGQKEETAQVEILGGRCQEGGTGRRPMRSRCLAIFLRASRAVSSMRSVGVSG